MQAERKDHGEEYAGHRHGEDRPGVPPAARRATADVQRACWQATKYPGKGVLHHFARDDAGLRRTCGDSLSCGTIPLVLQPRFRRSHR